VPVIPVELGGQRLSGLPVRRVRLERNLRAAGEGELSSKRHTEGFVAFEVPVEERGDIIARYREVAGASVRPCFAKLPDPVDHPVFKVGHR
jgi:hypothetical protein